MAATWCVSGNHRWSPRGIQQILLASFLLASGIIAPVATTAQSATPVPYAGAPSTAIVATATNAPIAVMGSDGMRHLDYDLLVTNTFLAPVTLTSIDVLGADGALLQRLEGDALVHATQPLLGSAPQEEIPVSGTVAVVMDVIVSPELAVSELRHTITYTVPADAPDQALIGSHATAGPDLPLADVAIVVIAPPLVGDGWLALNGCCEAASVHRFERIAAGGMSVAKAEMFAIDWMQLQDGKLNAGDGSQLEDYFGYGTEVRAATAGTVIYARDGLQDQAPGGEVVGIDHPEDFGGNQVMIEIEPGLYAWYAHLKPGSVAVDVGDVVEVGQHLGLLGNSGHSTAPHLHFGLLNAPNSTTGSGVPMVIDQYELVGDVDPQVLTAPEPPPDGRLPITPTTKGAQTETLPLYLTVTNFP